MYVYNNVMFLTSFYFEQMSLQLSPSFTLSTLFLYLHLTQPIGHVAF